MTADVQQGTLRHRVLMLIAALLFVTSLAAVVVGSGLTLFACTPGTDANDAYFLIRSGPLLFLGGVFGISKARRVWRLPRPHGTHSEQARPLSLSAELLWLATLIASAIFTTRLLIDAPPWSTAPVTLYGWRYVAQVVPLMVLFRILGSLLGIRLVPIVATLSLARRVPPTRVALVSGLGAIGLATMAYTTALQFPAMPHVLAFFVLDVALTITFATVGIESLEAAWAARRRLT